MTDTLILDEDGLYDPSRFNDRLLLGLKGTFSEAELHVLRARLRGGILNKARRGELKNPLPVGLVYDAQNCVILDPDQQIQQAIRTLFATFKRTGSATATVKFSRQQGLLFPRRLRRGVHKGQLLWVPLVHHRVLQVLHNPRFAGAFFHGRVHTRKDESGHSLYTTLPMEEWHTLLPETHPGYITWEQFQRHLQRLRDNAHAYMEQWGHRIQLHFLPTYAPETNPIERVWWHLHEEITRNHRCRNIDELLDLVFDWLRAGSFFAVETSLYESAKAA